MVNFVKSGQTAVQPKKVEKKIESESEESEEEESEESESELDKKKKSTVQTKASTPAAPVKKPIAASKKMEVESEEEEEEESEEEEEEERPSFGGGAKKVTNQNKTSSNELKKIEPVEAKSKVENKVVIPETKETSGPKQSFNKADYSRFSNLREEMKDYSFEVKKMEKNKNKFFFS